jgi:hypothetical protein
MNPKDFLLYFPLVMSYVLFAPFPWQIGGAFFLMGGVEMTLLYLSVPFIFRGIRRSFKIHPRPTRLIVLVFFAISSLLAVVESNVGTLFRHRSMTLYFVFIFLAVGLSRNREAKSSI